MQHNTIYLDSMPVHIVTGASDWTRTQQLVLLTIAKQCKGEMSTENKLHTEI